MGFFKPSGESPSSKSIARLQSAIWVLVYGGLLTLVLGLSVKRLDNSLGWLMVMAGGVIAGMGFALIFYRSRLKTDD